jgi:hypothetical protein
MRMFLVASCLFTAAAHGGVQVYAMNGLARPLEGQDELIVFDTEDPSGFAVIGATGVDNIGFGGLDFDADGNLWAYASFYKSTGGAAAGLYRVDPATGAATIQGKASLQSLQDIAFNPVDAVLYGINSQNNVSSLYTIDMTSGAVIKVGPFTGLPAQNHVMGFAIDSAGNFYIQELNNDRIYKGSGLALTQLYQLPQDTNFSQGMTIDWSSDDRGYHAAVGYGEFPHYFSQVNTFATDGSAYTLGPDFGEELGDGLPPVEPGDLAIRPGAGCYADFTGEGDLDLFDFLEYVNAFNASEDRADCTEEGALDFFDFLCFSNAFNEGC